MAGWITLAILFITVANIFNAVLAYRNYKRVQRINKMLDDIEQ